MKPAIDKPAKDWTFSVIDQGGTPVASQAGREARPPSLPVGRGQGPGLSGGRYGLHPAAGHHRQGRLPPHLYGQPGQFAVLYFKDKARTVVELSTKRIFQEKKTDFTKEHPFFWKRSVI